MRIVDPLDAEKSYVTHLNNFTINGEFSNSLILNKM